MSRLIGVLVGSFLLIQSGTSPSLPLQSAPTVEGVVLEAETGKPLAGVSISLAPIIGSPRTETDRDGRFTLNVGISGRYRVVPALSGFVFVPPAHVQSTRAPGAWVQIGAGQPIENVELRMAREGVIAGQVLGPKGLAFPGTVVTLEHYIYDSNGNRVLVSRDLRARLNDLGEYRLFGVPAGSYFVRIWGDVYSPVFYPGVSDVMHAVSVRIKAGEEIRLDPIQLPPPNQVQARFSFAEDVASTPTRRAMMFPTRGGSQSSSTIVRGEFTTMLPRGDYEAIVYWNARGAESALMFSRLDLHLDGSGVDREITMSRGVRVTGRVTTMNEKGERVEVPGVQCSLRSSRAPGSESSLQLLVRSSLCMDASLIPELYRFDLPLLGQTPNLPQDTYIVSVHANGKEVNFLTEKLRIEQDTELEVLISNSGGVVEGTVFDTKGRKLPDAVVAIVPDAPLRSAGRLYRSVISDVAGRFELHGIPPGAYKIFAWADLDGEAYRNAEFTAPFEGQGKAVRIKEGARLSMEVSALQSPQPESNTPAGNGSADQR